MSYDDTVPRITSRQHPVVRRLRRLASRREKGVVLLDGPHLLVDALAARVRVDLVLTDGRHAALAERARSAGATVHEGSAAVLEAASPVTSPTGVVAIAHWQPQDVSDVLAADAPVIGLVGVQDPGNVGSVIRSADALGAGGVLLLDGVRGSRLVEVPPRRDGQHVPDSHRARVDRGRDAARQIAAAVRGGRDRHRRDAARIAHARRLGGRAARQRRSGSRRNRGDALPIRR